MKASSILQFKSTPFSLLAKPWKKERDGTLFYGIAKTGTKRHALTTKQGNKNFYKGTRSSGVGKHTNKGRYIINWEKVRTFVVPTNFNPNLKPFVSPNATVIKNDYSGFKKGPLDPKLYFTKLREFIFYGTAETEAASLKKGYIERG